MSSNHSADTLFESALLRVVAIDWHADDSRPSCEFQNPLAEISFQRVGMFVKVRGGSRVACDTNTLAFINANETYRLAHPAVMRCGCTALYLSRNLLADILHESGGNGAVRRSEAFQFEDCPRTPELDSAHSALMSLARSADAVDPLAIEEAAVDVARRAIGLGRRFHAGRRCAVRDATARAHRDVVQNVKELLGAHFRERMFLDDIASAVYSAPTHLCRVFKQQTGFTMHRYLNRLRLAAAVERLAEPDVNLADLAVELGFSHHSHFTTTFRRELGVPPSRLRGKWPRLNSRA